MTKKNETTTTTTTKRSKLDLAQELVRVLPGALKGPQDTAERLAKRCTVAELETMLTEARTPLPQTGLAFPATPQHTNGSTFTPPADTRLTIDQVEGMVADEGKVTPREFWTASGVNPMPLHRDDVLATLEALRQKRSDARMIAAGDMPPTQSAALERADETTEGEDTPPAWLVQGARVHVIATDEDPEFWGEVVEVKAADMECSVREEGGTAFLWVSVVDVRQDERPPVIASDPDVMLHGLADAPADVTLPPTQVDGAVSGTDALLSTLAAEGVDWESMASEEAKAAEAAELAKKGREEQRRAAAKPKAQAEPKKARTPLPPVGTVLRHGDQEARVVETALGVLGVEFGGNVYASSTAAAEAAKAALGLTGAVSGPTYWGLRKRAPRPSKVTGAMDAMTAALAKAARWIVDHQGSAATADYLAGASALAHEVWGGPALLDALEAERKRLAPTTAPAYPVPHVVPNG